MLKVRGVVSDRNSVQSIWVGYRAGCAFAQLVEAVDKTTLPLPSELVVDVADDGNFAIALPDAASLDPTTPLTIRVFAPAGEELAKTDFKVQDLADAEASGTVLPFEVTPQSVFEIAPSNDPFLGTRPKLSGRVLDVAGQRLIAGRQVLIFALPKGAVGTHQDGTAIVVARTDPQGYFTADYPRDLDLNGEPGGPRQLSEAWALVAGATDLHGSPEIPVPLVDIGVYKGVLPRNVVLIVDVSADALANAGASAECESCGSNVPRAPDPGDLIASPTTYSMDLGGGRCVNLTTPNRSLEEFSFYTCVRTSDPQIIGLGDVDRTFVVPAEIVKAMAATAASFEPRADGTRGNAGAPIAPVGNAAAAGTTGLLAASIDPRIMANHLSAVGAATPEVLQTAMLQSAKQTQLSLLRSLYCRAASRAPLSASNPIDWDSDEPRFYEATSIAHGHLLHMKQVWRADGYSLGDLLYSLPLAPAQKKQIAVVDWERRETAARSESLFESESLQNTLTRDRDISEIVGSTLAEHMHGDSTSLTAATGEGSGAAGSGSYGSFLFGAVAGSALGAGLSSADANSDASRSLAANALQKIRDTTLQSASAVRNQRSTVIQTVNQSESVQVTTEVVANHNHCHAMTIEYFEVLRHFQITQELADVQECLLVPLLMAHFDARKALRWRDILFTFLRKPSLADGFDALDRIVSSYADADYPTGTFADETLRSLEGTLTVEIRLPTGGDAGVIQNAWNAFTDWLVGSSPTPPANSTNLQVEVVDGNGARTAVPMEFTLVSELVDRTPLYVRMQQTGAWTGAPTRANVDSVRFFWKMTDFPDGSQLLIRGGTLRYRTAHLRSHILFAEPNIDSGLTTPDAWVDTPLDSEEQRNLRHEDAKSARNLLAHLNEHLEYYHKAIWWSMDVDRRFMLLDGFVAPNANGRSVASVVENRLIGFIGNSMVLPVGPGLHLDPSYKQDPERPVDLLNLYAPQSPIPPMRVSIPTRGVFAEAVMGECNSCETTDETRFWRWDQAPTGDEPTPIQSPSTDTRATPDPNLTAKDFPQPIVNIQNAPAEPDPTGLAAALKVIGTPNIFKDITGLDQTQKNSLAAMQATLDAAKHFGDQAAGLVQQQAMQKGGIDKSLQSIQLAKKGGLVTDDQANQLTVAALKNLVGGSATDDAKPTAVDGLVPSLKDQVDKGGVKTLKATTAAGDGVEAEFATLDGTGGGGGGGGGGSAAMVEPFPPAFSDPLTADDQKLKDAFNAAIASVKADHAYDSLPNIDTIPIIMVALNANKTRPAVGTASAFTDMFYSGSMMKVAAMYAAHQLWQSVDDLVDGMDPAIVTDEAKVFAAVHTAFDAKILAASTLIKSSSTVGKRVPQYDLVFQPMKDPVSGKWSVIFRSDVDAKLDFQGHLKKMIVDSHNPSAGFVIQALGFSLIGGLLEQAGFFKPGSKKGVWLAGDYLDTAAKILAAHNDPSGDKDLKEEFNLGISGWNEVRVPSVNDGLSKQATTCIDMARLLVLMVDNRLVTDAIKNEAMLGLLHLAVFGGAKSLITRVAPSTFDIIQSKIGFGTLGTTGRCKADAAGHTHGCVWSETIHVKQNIAPFREFAVVYQNLKDPANNHLSDVERIRDVIAKTMENYQP